MRYVEADGLQDGEPCEVQPVEFDAFPFVPPSGK
jgi:hypothetical protein